MKRSLVIYCIWLAKNIVLILIVYVLAQRNREETKIEECKIVTRRLYIQVPQMFFLKFVSYKKIDHISKNSESHCEKKSAQYVKGFITDLFAIVKL